MKSVVLDHEVVARWNGKLVRVTQGLRKDREGSIGEMRYLYAGGLQGLVEFPNGAKHWHRVDTLVVIPTYTP